MKLPRFVRLAIYPAHPKVTEERIKARASAFQSIGLAVFGLSILVPLFSGSGGVSLTTQLIGGATTGLLFVVSQAILGYLPDPQPPATPKEDEQHG